ncbi:MAG: DNA methyltransferase [Acidimicrobiales bacterium mtb01]|nr:SAM-dependent DNA methyltransferase [Actinomycetota bacterium]TEX45704.1 MAG: DNA methyltransferase [Acidimicrobiales bacterium mtb01]
MSLSTTIKSLQDIMRKDAGVDGDAQRIGQLGWLLFFKIYSDLELEAEIEDERYVSPIPKGLHWSEWADQDALGKDAPTGEALIDLVENQLFPKLKNLDLDSLNGRTRERGALLRGVFEDAFNYMKNGTLLRQVINKLNADIDFNQSKTRHLFGDIYEQILRDLQSAGNAGEFYTPRAATQFAVQMIDPKLGETILDPACGTGGFLTHAYAHVQEKVRTPDDLELLKQSIHGVEKKSLPHLLCVTNMMIHGIEVPSNIRHDNTLARPLRDYGKADQVDIILTNPPFGGMEEDGIESNFPTEFRTRETADLFLVLVMELLKDGGRAAIVLPDGTLFGEGIKTRIKRKLLEECNLHTIVRLPNGVFAPYTSIKTNILFFTKGQPTKEVWYYEHPYPDGYRSYSRTKPMRIDEFEAERAWWTQRTETNQAWRVPMEDIAASGFNLDIRNPHTLDEQRVDPDMLLAQLKEAEEQVRTAQRALQAHLAVALGLSHE